MLMSKINDIANLNKVFMTSPVHCLTSIVSAFYCSTLTPNFCQQEAFSNQGKRIKIISLTKAKTFSHAVRSHWRIENKLHWHLDVVFREDDSRIR
jgi:predicted transposase YbfD/YdcC